MRRSFTILIVPVLSIPTLAGALTLSDAGTALFEARIARTIGAPRLDPVAARTRSAALRDDDLRKSTALLRKFGEPILPVDLQAELDRIVAESRRPDLLRADLAALGNDPELAAELIARPILVDNRLRAHYAATSRADGAGRRRDDTGGGAPAAKHDQPDRPVDDWWAEIRSSFEPATPEPFSYRLDPSLLSLGSCPAGNAWSAMSSSGAPSPRWLHTATWTGVYLVVWGGQTGSGGHQGDGGRYDPATNAWLGVTSTNAPSPRWGHVSQLAAGVVVIWGGHVTTGTTDTGAYYNAVADSWVTTSTVNAPAPRRLPMSVTTGSEVIVFGGPPLLNGGGRYDPTTNSWTPLPLASTGREDGTAVWDGNRMLVFGGKTGAGDNQNTGERYERASNSWSPMTQTGAPAGRRNAAGVWACDRFWIWAGSNFSTAGGLYDPVTDTWTTIDSAGNPELRQSTVAVPIGPDRIVLWGGPNYRADGTASGSSWYRPNGWGGIASSGEPSRRQSHSGTLAGHQFMVWGGFTDIPSQTLSTGGIYCADSACEPYTALACPAAIPAPSASITDSPDPVLSGTNLTFTITVQGPGSGCVGPITVTDTLPAGVTFVSATASVGACSGTSTVTCSLGTLWGSATATVTIVAKITQPSGTITNAGLVSNGTSSTPFSATTTITPTADLVVTKSASPNPVLVGGAAFWTITVANTGTSPATSVQLSDAVPAATPPVYTATPFTHDDGSATEFGGGTKVRTQWNAGASRLEHDGVAAPVWELPNGKSASGWIDMTANTALAHFSEAAGATSFADSSGGSPFTCGVCPTAAVATTLGTGLRFDGNSQRIQRGRPVQDDFTIAFWLQTTELRGTAGNWNAGRGLVDASAGGILNDFGISIGAGRIQFGTGNPDVTIVGPFVADGAWHHVVATRVRAIGEARLYLDGVPAGGPLGGSTGSLNAAANVNIGRLAVGSNNAAATIDEVAFWSRVLSPAEIAEIAFRQKWRLSGTYVSPVFDAGGGSAWSSLSWIPSFPTAKPLPDGGASESGYPAGNATMTGNALLFHFDEASGATAFADASGNSNHGTCTALCPVMSPAGRFSGSAQFESKSVTFAATAGVPIGDSPYAIEAWFRPSTAVADQGIVGWGNFSGGNGANGLKLGALCGGGFTLVNTWSGTDLSACLAALTINRWNHVAATFDGTTRRLFFDGAQVASDSPTGHAAVATGLVVGSTNGADFAHGLVDELAVFSRGLSPTEIADHYARGIASLRMEVRSCDDAACVGESFTGPDGTPLTAFGESGLGLPSASLALLPPNRWLQYEAFFGSDGSLSPGLRSITGIAAVPALTTSAGSCSAVGASVSCSLGTIAPGATVTVTIPVTTPADATATNVASATTALPQPVTSNDSATATLEILAANGDRDGDGSANSVDCRPLDGTVFAAPAEAVDLRIVADAGGTLTWSAPASPGGTGAVYDVLRADSPNGFATAACIASGQAGTGALDPAVPIDLACYLIRARNACGSALGSDSAGNPVSGATCP